jgi:hypothetical protein
LAAEAVADSIILSMDSSYWAEAAIPAAIVVLLAALAMLLLWHREVLRWQISITSAGQAAVLVGLVVLFARYFTAQSRYFGSNFGHCLWCSSYGDEWATLVWPIVGTVLLLLSLVAPTRLLGFAVLYWASVGLASAVLPGADLPVGLLLLFATVGAWRLIPVRRLVRKSRGL